MTPQLHTRTGLTAGLALAITAALLTGAPADAMPLEPRSPDARQPQTATAAPGHLLGKHPSDRQDLRSPDAKDAAEPSQYSTDLAWLKARNTIRASSLAGTTSPMSSDDLRSPDARDAGRTVVAPPQDLRSPDARDAGRTVPMTPRTTLPSYPVALPAEPASPVATDGGGAEWGTIGLAGAVTLLAAGGLALVLARRSRRAHRMGATA